MRRPLTLGLPLAAILVVTAALAQQNDNRTGADTMGRAATGASTGLGVSGTGATSPTDVTTGASTGTGASLGPGPAPGAVPSPSNPYGRAPGPTTGTGSAGVAPGAPLTGSPASGVGMTAPGMVAPGTTRPGTTAGATAPDPRMLGPGFPSAYGFGPAYGVGAFTPGFWGAYGSGFTTGYGPGVYQGTPGTDVFNTEAIPGAPGTGTSGIPFGTRESTPATPGTDGTVASGAPVGAAPSTGDDGGAASITQPSVTQPSATQPSATQPSAPAEDIEGAPRVSSLDILRAPVGSTVTLTSPVTTVFGPQLFAVAGRDGDVLVLLPREATSSLSTDTNVTVTGTVRPFVDADVYAAQGYFDADPALIEEMRSRPVLVARTLDRDGLALLTDDGPAEATPLSPRVSAIAANPEQYEGARVTLRGDVVDVDSLQRFTLVGAPGEVAVVHSTPLSDSPRNDEVTVTGVVRRFTEEMREEYPWLNASPELEGRPVVVAELVLQE